MSERFTPAEVKAIWYETWSTFFTVLLLIASFVVPLVIACVFNNPWFLLLQLIPVLWLIAMMYAVKQAMERRDRHEKGLR